MEAYIVIPVFVDVKKVRQEDLSYLKFEAMPNYIGKDCQTNHLTSCVEILIT